MIVSNAVLADGELFVRGLVHEMKAITIAVKKRHHHDFYITLWKFLARPKTLFLHRSVQQILQPRPHHRACTACSRRCEEDIEHLIGLAFDFDQDFFLEFVRSDKWHR